MKRIVPLFLAVIISLSACGKTNAPQSEETTAAQTAAETTRKPWDGTFPHLSTVLPEGWTVTEDTESYFQAQFGKSDDAPVLMVSVTAFSDALAHVKAKMLADTAQVREADSATKVEEIRIGSLPFYALTYASHLREGTLCRTCFGQSEPASGSRDYKLVEIRLDKITDEAQLQTLEKVLSAFSFRL